MCISHFPTLFVAFGLLCWFFIFYSLIHNLQYRERVIFIGQHIDEEFSNQILATMLYLDSMDSSKKLYLYINGPGGDVSSFWVLVFYLCALVVSCIVNHFLLESLLQYTPCIAVYDIKSFLVYSWLRAWLYTTPCKAWKVQLPHNVLAMPII